MEPNALSIEYIRLKTLKSHENQNWVWENDYSCLFHLLITVNRVSEIALLS